MNLLKKTYIVCLCISCIVCSQKSTAQESSIPSEQADFRVFPNPNQNSEDTYVSLQGFKADNLLVIVFDMLGREIYSKVEVMENGGFLFTLSSDGKKLPSGVYLISASANDKVFRQKLIVK